jgi:8-oxo-dGTP diphosphatase
MIRTANVILHTSNGQLILQQRDDKPGISNPGEITAFGGSCGPQEEPLQAAKREMQEELGLNLQDSELEFWKIYRKTMDKHGEDAEVNLFILERPLNPEELTVYEGQGYCLVAPGDDLDRLKLTTAARDFVAEYFQTYHHGD